MSSTRWLPRWGVFAAAAFIAGTLVACKVPVFRYALERWSVDHYRMVVLLPKQSVESATSLVDELKREATTGNVDVEVIDLSTLSEADLWQLEEVDLEASTPQLQVFYPLRQRQQKRCWQGDLTSDAIHGWFQSPLRAAISEDIVGGVSAVWLLVEGDDPEQNDRLANLVSRTLTEVQAEIAIPEGVISRKAADSHFKDNPEASMDDVLRSDIPLKIEFRLRRLETNDRTESALRTMIAGFGGEDLSPPLLVPVFGRGRMLDALDANSITPDTIGNVCNYIVGECSCTVKALNPGVDMILQVDWQEKLGNEIAIVGGETNLVPELIEIPGRQEPRVASNSIRWIGALTFALLLGLTFRYLIRK
ncbi:MAG: hypothetical protein AB8B91_08565 [Rubripirellula sp.]